mmetsp:Transcript_17949/g.58110  ORF Transcript_17949/g.58110 Transcript_17949/m.58110 type:complete len:206 (+) Transcript_17949:341-958(+)
MPCFGSTMAPPWGSRRLWGPRQRSASPTTRGRGTGPRSGPRGPAKRTSCCSVWARRASSSRCTPFGAPRGSTPTSWRPSLQVTPGGCTRRRSSSWRRKASSKCGAGTARPPASRASFSPSGCATKCTCTASTSTPSPRCPTTTTTRSEGWRRPTPSGSRGSFSRCSPRAGLSTSACRASRTRTVGPCTQRELMLELWGGLANVND